MTEPTAENLYWMYQGANERDTPVIPLSREFVRKLAIRLAELEAAIRTHRDTKADDRCIEDDDTLYAVLGDGIKCDRRVGDKDAMLENCKRYISQRCEGGGPWITYAQMKDERDEATKQLAVVNDELNSVKLELMSLKTQPLDEKDQTINRLSSERDLLLSDNKVLKSKLYDLKKTIKELTGE